MNCDLLAQRRLISKIKKENTELRRFNEKLQLDINSLYQKGKSLDMPDMYRSVAAGSDVKMKVKASQTYKIPVRDMAGQTVKPGKSIGV